MANFGGKMLSLETENLRFLRPRSHRKLFALCYRAFERSLGAASSWNNPEQIECSRSFTPAGSVNTAKFYSKRHRSTDSYRCKALRKPYRICLVLRAFGPKRSRIMALYHGSNVKVKKMVKILVWLGCSFRWWLETSLTCGARTPPTRPAIEHTPTAVLRIDVGYRSECRP